MSKIWERAHFFRENKKSLEKSRKLQKKKQNLVKAIKLSKFLKSFKKYQKYITICGMKTIRNQLKKKCPKQQRIIYKI